MSLDVLTRDRMLRMAGVALPVLEERRRPYVGQKFKHGWIPVAGVPVELLTPEEADRDYGDELDRVEFDDGTAIVARSEGALTVESDGGGVTQVLAAPSPEEALGWADYIDAGLDLDEGDSTTEGDLTVVRTADGLSLRWPEGDEDSDPQDYDGVELAEGDVAGFTQGLRDMAYVTEDNAAVPDDDEEDDESQDSAMLRHRTLQLLGVEVRAFNPGQKRAPKGTETGGEWISMSARIGSLLRDWMNGGQQGSDPLAGFSQPQLKKAAEQLGLNPPKGMRLVPLKGLLMSHAQGGMSDAPTAPKAAKKTAKRAAPIDAKAIAGGLAKATSREQAHELLSGLSVKDLRAVGAEVNASFAGVTKADQFRTRIVEQTVGARLNSATLMKGGNSWADETGAKSPAGAKPTRTESQLDQTLRTSSNPAELKAAAEEWNRVTGGKFHGWVSAYGNDFERMAKDNQGTTKTLGAAEVAERVSQLGSEQEIIAALDKQTGPSLRRVAKELGVQVPAKMDSEAVKAHLARSVMAFGSSGTDLRPPAAGATSGKKATTPAPFDASSTAAALRETVASRADGEAMVAAMRKPELVELGRELSLPGAASMSMARLRREIVEGTVGRRLDSQATRGFKANMPGGAAIDLGFERYGQGRQGAALSFTPIEQDVADLAEQVTRLGSESKARDALLASGMDADRLKEVGAEMGVRYPAKMTSREDVARHTARMMAVIGLARADTYVRGGGGAGPADLPDADVRQRVQDVTARLAARPGDLVSLVWLRAEMADIPREQQDRILKQMDRERIIQLEPDPNQSWFTPDIREAAVRLGGEDKHFVFWLGGPNGGGAGPKG